MPDHPPNLDAAIAAAQAACPNTWQGTIRRILIAAWPALSQPSQRGEHDHSGGQFGLAPLPRTRHIDGLPPRVPQPGPGPWALDGIGFTARLEQS